MNPLYKLDIYFNYQQCNSYIQITNFVTFKKVIIGRVYSESIRGHGFSIWFDYNSVYVINNLFHLHFFCVSYFYIISFVSHLKLLIIMCKVYSVTAGITNSKGKKIIFNCCNLITKLTFHFVNFFAFGNMLILLLTLFVSDLSCEFCRI